MLKSLFIQQLYCLSDEQLERELADRISFRMFLGRQKSFLVPPLIWKFRERLGAKSYFGYKLHGAMDENYGLIRRIEVTPANVHDSQVDPANEGEFVMLIKDILEPRQRDTMQP
jgi:IS5 family transposase